MLNWSHSVAQAEEPPDNRVKLSGRPVTGLANERRHRAGTARRLRGAMDHNTIVGGVRVDRDGAQIGHTMLLVHWPDGKRVIGWPAALAPGKTRFPPPPWSQRR